MEFKRHYSLDISGAKSKNNLRGYVAFFFFFYSARCEKSKWPPLTVSHTIPSLMTLKRRAFENIVRKKETAFCLSPQRFLPIKEKNRYFRRTYFVGYKYFKFGQVHIFVDWEPLKSPSELYESVSYFRIPKNKSFSSNRYFQECLIYKIDCDNICNTPPVQHSCGTYKWNIPQISII